MPQQRQCGANHSQSQRCFDNDEPNHSASENNAKRDGLQQQSYYS
jgi:hypothetical protein